MIAKSNSLQVRFIKAFTIIELLIVVTIIGLLSALGSRVFFEVYQNYYIQRNLSLGQTQLNIIFDRLYDVHLTPLFLTLAKPLSIDPNGEWIIFANYKPIYDQAYDPNNTYLSQIVRLEIDEGILIKTTFNPPSSGDDTLYPDTSSDFKDITDNANFKVFEILTSTIDDINFSYLDINQATTTNTQDIANIAVDTTATRFNIQRSRSLILSPRRLLWTNQ